MKARLLRLLREITCVLLAGVLPIVHAGPNDGQLLSGTGQIATNGAVTTITAGNNSVIRWGGFNIDSGETVRFVQPGSDARVLNLIGNTQPTRIDGSLLANGQVYLMNSAGIYFGQSAVVNVGGLYAVGGSMSKEDFLAGLNRFTGITGEVRNEGSIQSPLVALVGRSVTNTGSIVAPGGFVGLVSGDQVFLRSEGSRILVDTGTTASSAAPAEGKGVVQQGTIEAPGGTVALAAGDLYAVAIAQNGRIRARDVRLQGQARGAVLAGGSIDVSDTSAGAIGGSIEVTGEKVGVTTGAVFDASGAAGGGTILIGGDYQGTNAAVRNATATVVQAGAKLVADATAAGDGGKIVVWSDGSTSYGGALSARGGPNAGNGGFAEVSGKGFLDFAGTADLRAAFGHRGTLLLDPTNIFIATNAANADAAGMQNNSDPTGSTVDAGGTVTFAATGPKRDSLLTVATLVAALNSADVIVTGTTAATPPDGAGDGNITVVDAVSSSAGNSLRLAAANNLNINAAIDNTGGEVVVTSGGGMSFGANVTGSIVTIDNAGSLSWSAGVVTANQVIIMGAGGVGSSAAPLSLATPSIVLSGKSADTFLSNAGGVAFFGSLTGNLTASATGAITDAAALTVTGTANLSAGATNDITLDDANNFGTVAIGSANNVTLNDADGIDLGASTISGTLNVTAAGAITDSGALAVTGTTTLAAGSGNDITLDAGNNFSTVSITSANNVTLNDVNALALGGSTVSGTLNVTTAGAITDSGVLNVTGAATFSAGSGNDITLDAGNNFSTVSIGSGNNVTLNDTAALDLGASTISGNLTVTTGGDITDSGALAVNGTTTLTATSVAGSSVNITLDAGNNFNVIAIGGGGNVYIGDTNAVALGASTISGGLIVDAGGNITQSGPGGLNVTGLSSFGVTADESDILLTSTSNVMTGAVSFRGTVTNIRDFSLVNTSATAALPSFDGVSDLRNVVANFTAAPIALTGTVTTRAGGSQNYQSAVTLTGATTLNANDGAVTFGSTVGGAQTLTISTSGNIGFGGSVGSSGTPLTSLALTGTGAANFGGDVTTAGIQTYGGNVTLTGTGPLTLTGSVVTFQGRLDGGRALSIAGSAVFGNDGTDTVGAATALTSLSVSGTTTLNSSGIRTTGTQVYNGAFTLGADTTLTGSSVQFANTFSSAAPHSLEIAGDASFTTALSGLTALSVSGTTSLAGSVSTSGAQTYTGLVTLGGNTTLTSTGGSQITLTAGADSATAVRRDLTVSNGAGATIFGGASGATNGLGNVALNGTGATTIGSLNALSLTTASSAVTLNGAIDTQSTQTYAGTVLLAGDTTLTTNNALVSLAGGVNSSTTTRRALTINNGTGATTLGTVGANGLAAVTLNGTGLTTLGSVNATSLSTGTGASVALNGNVVTSGAQNYNGAATLGAGAVGSTQSFTGSQVNFNGTLTGVRALSITGAASFASALTNLTSLSVTGTTALNGNVTTDGTQNYGGLLTLGTDTTLATTNATVTLGGGVDSATATRRNLTINNGTATTTLGAATGPLDGLGIVSLNGSGAKSIGTLDAISLITGVGAITLNGSITTVNAQVYNGVVSLSDNTTLTTSNAQVSLASGVNSATTTRRDLTINNGAGTTTIGAAGTGNALGVVALNGTGTTSLAAVNATSLSTGTGAAVTLGGDVTTTGTQAYNGAATLAAGFSGSAQSFTGSLVSFNGTLTGRRALTINGNASFAAPLAQSSLTVTGTTTLTGNVTTDFGQNYTGLVTLGANTTLTSSFGSAITLTNGVDSAVGPVRDFAISNGLGTVTLGGASGAANGLGTVSLLGSGTKTIGSLNAFSFAAGAGLITLNGPITTTQAQTYTGTVRLNGDTTLTTTDSLVSLANVDSSTATRRALTINNGTGATTLGPAGAVNPLGVVTLNGTGATTLGATNSTSLATGLGAALTLNGDIATTGTQVYNGAATLAAGGFGTTQTFTGTQITFNGGIEGNRGLSIVGNAVLGDGVGTDTIGGTFSLTSLLVSGSTTLNSASVTTFGTQTYVGPLTLGVDTALAASTVNIANTLNGARALAITGNASFGGVIGGSSALTSLSVSGTSSLGGNATTTGTQTYTGAVSLLGSTTFAGSSISFGSTLSGPGSLNVTGNASFASALSGFTSLGVTGTTSLAGDVTTSGTQNYGGLVTLNGNTILTTTNSAVTLTAGVNSASATPRALTINHGAGTATLGDSGAVQPLGAVVLTGTGPITLGSLVAASLDTGAGALALNGDINTTGAQTYGGDVVLGGTGATRTLTGTTLTFNSRLDGARALALNGNAVFGDAVSDFVGSITPLTSLTVSGTTNLNTSSVRTTGLQTYTGNVALGTDATLVGSNVLFIGSLSGGQVLTITGDAGVTGATNIVGSISVSGAVTLTGSLTTTGSQTYLGAVTLGTDTTLTGTTLTFDSTIDGAHSLTLMGDAVFGGDVGGTTALTSLLVSGTTSLTGNVTTTGTQTYSGVTTLTSPSIFTGSTVIFGSALSGSGALTIDGNASFGVGLSGFSTVSVTGTTSLSGNITTTGAQTYTGAIMLGGDTTLTTTNAAVTLAAGIDSDSATPRALTVNNGTGTTTLGDSGTVQALGAVTLNGTGDTTLNTLVAASLSTNAASAVTLNGDVTTTGAQLYGGDVTLAGGGATRSLIGTTVTFNGRVDGGRALAISGNAVFGNASTDLVGALTALTSVSVSGTTSLNAASFRTTGAQTYTGAVTLGGDATLTGSTLLFAAGVSGPGALALVGNADITTPTGGLNSLTALSVTGTTALTGNVTTTGTQTYTGAFTLRSNSVLTGSQVNFGGALNGASTLSILGNLALSGSSTSLNALSVSGVTTMTGSVTTVGAQTYTGRATLTGNTTLTSTNSAISLAGGAESSGAARSLTIGTGTGAVTLGSSGTVQALGAVALNATGPILLDTLNATSLTTGAGATTLNGNVTTSGAQSYAGNVTLGGTGADRTFSGTTVAFAGTVDGSRGLAITGNASFGGATGAGTALSSLAVSGTTQLNGSGVRTVGAQSYQGAVTLGADNALVGAGISFGSTVNGARALSIGGSASFAAGLGGTTPLASLTVDGASVLNGDMTTTGNQTYGGAVTLGGGAANSARTLTGSLVAFNGTVDGGRALTVTGNARFGDGAADTVGGTGPLASLAVTGTTVLNGGAVTTIGAQTYTGAATLGTSVVFLGSDLTFGSSLNAATGATANLAANISGATLFGGPVGQTGRLGAVTTDAAGTTTLRGSLAAASVNIADAVRFEGSSALTVDTTGNQSFAQTLQLSTGLTLNSTGGGLNLQQGATGAGQALTLTTAANSAQASITVGGDLGSSSARLQSLKAAGYNVSVSNVFTTDDLAIAIGSDPGTLTSNNPSLEITGSTLDSQNGALVLGSGAGGNGSAKTGAPLRASIFKASGDLTLLGRTVTIQPYERVAVRDGSLAVYGDESITLSSMAASRALVMVSPRIEIRSRAPQSVATTEGALESDLGTDLVAGRVLFYRGGADGAPARGALSLAPEDLLKEQGNLLVNVPETIVVLAPSGGGAPLIFVADLSGPRSVFRPVAAGVSYLDLATAVGLGGSESIDPERFGAVTEVPSFTVVASGQVRGTIGQSYAPSMPRENQPVAPTPAELEPAVREQLATLGIYARALVAAEQASRGRKAGLFVVVPDRSHPLDEDYKVVDARVEQGSVREVLRLAAEGKLSGDTTRDLSEVADALAATYETFSTATNAQGGPDDALRYRAWLLTNPSANATKVLEFARAVNAMFEQVALLGLTQKEIEVSKSYIYGSILLPRLNAEVEFLRRFIEAPATDPRLTQR